MKRESKFDAVTILGLALAAALFIGGIYYSKAKNEANQRERLKQQAEFEAAMERAKKESPPVLTQAGENKPGETKPAENKPEAQTTKENKPAEPTKAPEAEVQLAPDITVMTDGLDLIFTARGGTLLSATLTNEYVDAAAKKQKSLEILAEIQQGQRTFGLPSFDIGPADPNKQKEHLVYDDKAEDASKSLDKRAWHLDSNSGAFDANGEWKIVYSTKLNDFCTATKTFTVNRKGNLLFCSLAVANTSSEPLDYVYALNGPAGVLLDGPPQNPKGSASYVAITGELAGRDEAASENSSGIESKTISTDAALKEDDSASISSAENLWGAVKNRFYMSILISRNPTQLIKLKAVPVKHVFNSNDPLADDKRYQEKNLGIQGVRRRSANLAPGKKAEDQYALYIAPAN